MQLNFGASLKLHPGFQPENFSKLDAINEGRAFRFVMKGTDPDILVTLQPRSGGGSEGLIQINKPESALPKSLKDYVFPQKFCQFRASDIDEVGGFTGVQFRMHSLRAQIMDKVLELHQALHPSQPLGLKEK